ncbi:MAG TPA: hypothetical protein OIM63_02880 [Bacilli bacterium]|jgi:hypothetical protein|nr:hypothetical protein [Bacilli bacterium]
MKQFYKENRVFSILMIVVAVCLLLIIGITLKYFIFGSSSSPYGDRLKDEKKYKISDDLKTEVKSTLESDESIKKASVRVSVRTIYISMEFNTGVSLEEAKGKAVTALEKFSEDELGYYDVEFILTEESADNSEGFTIMGAKNVNGSNIVWNNNTPVTTE